MDNWRWGLGHAVAVLVLLTASVPSRGQDTPAWVELSGAGTLEAWRQPRGQWALVAEVDLKEGNRRLLEARGEAGPILYNGPVGRTPNLVTREQFEDVELVTEFLISERSNSGVKFQGIYEIQISDSAKKARATASDCGGIYPRAELLPTYHHIDEGYPPLSNAARAPGEWQSLEVRFRAPHFDEKGRKTANAQFEKVVLNGVVIHENVEVPFGTGHAWHKTEQASGPILLQGDHGPVAFRGLKVRRLEPNEAAGARGSSSGKINAPFVEEDLDVAGFVERFESGDREVFVQREAIVKALGLKPGMVVTDIGAGTGLFTRLFARQVGKSGVVLAVDINPRFLEHIEATARAEGLEQVHGVLGNQVSPNLGDESIDVAFVCDTYHHLEQPEKYMAAVRRALRKDGRLVVVEMDKHEGASEFVKEHIRASKDVFIREIEAAGFERVEAGETPPLVENFFAVFRRAGEPGHE
jgi:SAM-dependent methyltransferase